MGVPLRVRRDLSMPADEAWDALTDLDAWPRWGPSVRSATLDDGSRRLAGPARGRVRTAVGAELPFEVHQFDPGQRWAWRVAGVPATGHQVATLGPTRCRVTFEVPMWAAAYAPLCWYAIGTLGAQR